MKMKTSIGIAGVIIALMFVSCGKNNTDLNRLNFKEHISSVLYGDNTTSGMGSFSGMKTIETHGMENYTFDKLKFTSGNSTGSLVTSNVRFHITKDSIVNLAVIELYKTDEALKLYNYLDKKLGMPLAEPSTPMDNGSGIMIGFTKRTWDYTSEGKSYILIGSYSVTKSKTQAFELMLYILDINNNILKNNLLRGNGFSQMN